MPAPPPLRVRLTPEQIEHGTRVGHQRQAVHEGRSYAEVRIDASRSAIALHVQGAIAEKAVSVALDRPWDGAFRDHAEWLVWRHTGHDVDNLEIRATHHRNGGLPVHKRNPDHAPFVLVLDADAPEFVLAGWIFGKDAKQDRYWNTGKMHQHPCYLVPQSDLRPCSELHSRADTSVVADRPAPMTTDQPQEGRFGDEWTDDPGPDELDNV